jgi:TPR repeat protein
MKIILKIILYSIYFATLTCVNAQSFQEMQAIFERKDFATAFAGFLRLAEQNDSEAQSRVASMYASGQGVVKDEKRGHEWAEKSAANGNLQGQYVLGINYMIGRGTSKNATNAFYWFDKAYKGGHPFVHSNLALLYRRGNGVSQDFPKALEILRAAVSSGDPRTIGAHMQLAEMYERGEGVIINKAEALRHLYAVKQKVQPDTPSFLSAQKSIERIESTGTAPSSTIPAAPAAPMVSSASIGGGVSRSITVSDPKKDCEIQLKNDNKLSVIASKISLSGASDIGFAMLADQTFPNQVEQKIIALYADGVRKCVKDADPIRRQKYSSEVNLAFAQFDADFMDAAIELYNKKITYGKFNTKLQQLDKTLNDKLTGFTTQANAQKNEQDEANRARADAMRDAQRRQDQARQADEQRIQQQRQTEQERINANRSRWVARCNLDKANAFAQGKVRYKEECDNTYRNASNTAINRMGVIACALSIDTQAEEYAKVTFDACMSGAP